MTTPIRPLRADRSEGVFDLALAGAARSLAFESLPAGVLNVPRPVAPRSWLRFGAPLAATVATVVLAISFVNGAPKAPGASQAPVFRTDGEISFELRSMGYSCHPGAAASPGRPRMDALVCTANDYPLAATVIVSEDPAGRVGEIHVDVDILGTPTATAELDRSDLLKSLMGMPIADPASAAAARAWLTGELPLNSGEQVSTAIDGIPVDLERVTGGGYRFVLGDLGAGGSDVPSR